MKYIIINNKNYKLLENFKFYDPILLEEIKNKEKTGFAIINDRIIIGCLLIQFDNKNDHTFNATRVYLKALVLQKEFRNQGLGTQLIIYAAKELKKQGFEEITFGVDDDNEIAKNFYKRFGFKFLYRDTEYDGYNFDVFVSNINNFLDYSFQSDEKAK